MPREFVIWGPAGTGKTTAGTSIARGWFDGGAAPGQVAYLGFTRAAARAAAQRIVGNDIQSPDDLADRFPLFRTLHSLAFMGLRKARKDVRVVTTSDMKRFSVQTGFEGTFSVHEWEDLADVYSRLQDQGKTHWDEALTAYTLSRISARTPADVIAAKTKMSPAAMKTIGALDDDTYSVLVGKYEAFKAAEGLIDFTDMLVYALTEMPPMDDCRFVVIDEAQDLSPILHGIADRLFRSSEEVWWIGDDYQAIYSFAAASADLFLDRAATASHQIQLRQTHRFNQSIVDFSDKIIQRVSRRMPKEIIGAPNRKGHAYMSGEFQPRAGRLLVLHRHVAGCQRIADAYIDAGLPFTNERGKSPLDATNRVKAWTAMNDLATGKRIQLAAAQLLFDELIPSVAVNDQSGTKSRLVVHGGKKKLETVSAQNINVDDLIALDILTPDGAGVIRNKVYDVLTHRDDLEYYDKVVRNGYDLESEGATITTIHGSKGRDADGVIVFSEMGRRCWEDPDTEHRLAYVASTRTKGDLEVCAERTSDWMATKYDYPMEE